MQNRELRKLTQEKLKGYRKLSMREKKDFELSAVDDFLFWSRKTWCQFMYFYADNAENRENGRAGKATSIRFGTRNLDLIPSRKRPKTRNKSIKTVRYFDTGKFGKIRGADGKYKNADGAVVNGLWRSFRRDQVIMVLKIWSFERNKFVTDFEDFNIRDTAAS
ncbi:hypothetical protein [Pontibacter mangrovi]|uniref:Uncharacterized protein n=1 Tax=Pontibacter mangrovi TaxID=2589816 RepID=A0A501WH59_9BACT|nr:hypothetical protein [Pontibacter mangrovi]TPE44926.1 hypothetical protein FJM65_07890 [Pontibacter mangrovi]